MATSEGYLSVGEGVIVWLAYSLRLSIMTAVATQTCFIQFILRFSQPLADDEIQHYTSHLVLFAQ